MTHHRDAAVQHLQSSSSALLLTLGLAWASFGAASVVLGRPKIALVHAGAVLAVAVLWAATRGLPNGAVRRAHGGAAVSVIGLCGVAMFSRQSASLACWYLPIVPMFVAQVAGWRAVAGWSLAGFSCFGLVVLSERVVVVEPEHVFTVLETEIGVLVITTLALGYSAFTRHIAERRLDEDEQRRDTVLEQAQELARVHAKLAQLHENVLRESTAKSRLMAQVSHEIRTPLTGLLGLSEVLADAPLDAAHLEMVRALHSSASALRQLVEDLLDVTRIQEGRLTLHAEPIDLRDLVGDVVDTFAVVAQRKGLDLAAIVDAAVPSSVTVDALRVRQIASNLLGNALKFTRQGEIVIHVSGDTSEGVFRGRIEVRDTGSGIDPKVLPTLFEAFEQGLDQLYALPDMAAGEDAVQILTIHKAKGLEFDHVIVPGLGKTPPAEGSKLFLWMERPAKPDASIPRRWKSGTHLLLAPIEETGAEGDPIYAWIKQLAAEKAAFEDGRLLYVAATRAKQRLHLLGETRIATGDGAQAARKPDARSLLAKLWPVVESEFDRAAAVSAPVEVAADIPSAGERGEGWREPEGRDHPERWDERQISQALRRLPSAWISPEPPPALAWAAGRETAHAQDDIEYSWAGETARHVGSVVHRWLQIIAEDELQGWSAARIDTLRARFRNELVARGVEEAQLAGAAGRVAAALANALADPRGRWLLGPQRDARNEYRLTSVVEGERRNLVIDRSFTDEKGKRWIVDYKASGHEGTNVEGFLDQQQQRYRVQLERYAQALAQGDASMLGLYFPLLAGWREWGG